MADSEAISSTVTGNEADDGAAAQDKVDSSLLDDDLGKHGGLRDNSRWKRMLAFVNKCWIWEMLSWFISAACMAAIVIVLLKLDGRPLPEWPFSIQLNSVLSVLAVSAKATLVLPVSQALSQLKWTRFRQTRPLLDLQRFDDASRGPYGASMLLFKGGWFVELSLQTLFTMVAMRSLRF